jgi:hypothetical protein
MQASAADYALTYFTTPKRQLVEETYTIRHLYPRYHSSTTRQLSTGTTKAFGCTEHPGEDPRRKNYIQRSHLETSMCFI